MEKTIKINIEQCDNGAIFTWEDTWEEDEENMKIVALDGDESNTIGKEIWGTIAYIMNLTLSNVVEATITLKAEEPKFVNVTFETNK